MAQMLVAAEDLIPALLPGIRYLKRVAALQKERRPWEAKRSANDCF